jgi:2-polyprenyl-6-methoxyphenol hydroxylase-like FAD-dependent oxidoreductase
VGLTTACLLDHFGIKCIIFDKKEEPTQTSNAILINMQALQLLKPLGITAKLIEQGLHMSGFSVYASNKLLAHIEIDDPSLPFDYQLTLPQSHTEEILRKHLKVRGVEIYSSYTLEDYVQTSDAIELTVSTSKGRVKIDSSWLFACDGCYSTVRKLTQIKGYEHSLSANSFIMIDAMWEAEQATNRLNAFFQPDISLLIIPYAKGGRSRFIAEIGRSAKFKQIDVPSLDDFKQIAASCVPFAHKISDRTWSSRFSIVERVADQFQKGNIFLLGDAAHSHSPAGGMGMNTGIQDAMNLCWKLNMVSNNQISHLFLNTYNSERRYAAKQVISASNAMTRMITIKQSLLFRMRNFVLKFMMKFDLFKNLFLRRNNQISLRYPSNELIVKSRLSDFRSGKAMPGMQYIIDSDTFDLYNDMDYKHFYLLAFGDKEAFAGICEKIGDELPILFLHKSQISLLNKKLSWPTRGFIVIRPDAYIALATTSESQAILYFTKMLKKTRVESHTYTH